VFQSSRNGITSIWALREKRGLLAVSLPEPVPLTTGPMNFYAPLPSADGKKLFVLGEQRRGELVRYDEKSRQFGAVLSGISAQGLDYSRNGEWVTYVTYPDGILWRCKADGSQRLQLTFAQMRAAWPRWSPDGRRIAFAATSPGKPWKIHLVSSDGGNPQELLPMDRDETEPNWSPDGNLLVFGRNPFWEPGAPAPMAIEILDLRTHETSALSGSEGLWSPRWSPDGRYISAYRPDSKGLSLFDTKTHKWERLDNDLLIGWVSWSVDAEYLYFDTIFGDDPSFFRLRVTDHRLERIVGLKNVGRAFGDMYWWSGITPDGSPLVLRDVGTQEIYALDWEAP
jgi:Tol biopolymer transport system component